MKTELDLTQWPQPTREARPWTRWWWFGSAVNANGLTAALEEIAASGAGGVEICPIYGARGHEEQYLPFLSEPWVAALAHTLREAERLGLGVDLTTGTGWPFGGPQVREEIASRAIKIDEIELSAGEELNVEIDPDNFEAAVVLVAGGERLLLGVENRGRLKWRAPSGGARVYVASRTGPVQKVKRAAPGGEGWVVDPFSPGAMEEYLAPFEEALERLGGVQPRAHFHDSFEYFGANWTPRLCKEFRRRRGYDLERYFPELQGHGDAELVRRVRCDYRQTLHELHLEFIERWSGWARGRGSLSRNQAHGTPANIIDLYAAADIPETEIFGDVDPRLEPMFKFASSAAHLTGRQLASAESFTWLDEHFQSTLGNLKQAADRLFLGGLNHLIYHGTPYSPEH